MRPLYRVLPTSLLLICAVWMPASAALALSPAFSASDAHAAQLAAAPEVAADDVDFSGAIALNGCSGALVRFTSSSPADHALALTNGHCYEGGPLHAGEVLTDRKAYREFKLLRPDGSRTLALLKVERLLYATMTGTDVALYQLSMTYDEIAARYATQPLTIAEQPAPAGTPIRLVSGLWKKIYACQIDGYVAQLREGEWTFTNALRYSAEGCDIIPGTSGSPLINPATGEIVGINNTRNRSGERCTENNPCEVSGSGAVTVLQGRGYGEELSGFYGCLGPDNSIDLQQPSCTLAKP